MTDVDLWASANRRLFRIIFSFPCFFPSLLLVRQSPRQVDRDRQWIGKGEDSPPTSPSSHGLPRCLSSRGSRDTGITYHIELIELIKRGRLSYSVVDLPNRPINGLLSAHGILAPHSYIVLDVYRVIWHIAMGPFPSITSFSMDSH